MKTFEKKLKPRITPKFIKDLCELAEGFEYADIYNKGVIFNGSHWWINSDNFEEDIFPLLLHRAVGKVKNIVVNYESEVVYIKESKDLLSNRLYYFKNYQLCHLTTCEMAILDCLKEALK